MKFLFCSKCNSNYFFEIGMNSFNLKCESCGHKTTIEDFIKENKIEDISELEKIYSIFVYRPSDENTKVLGDQFIKNTVYSNIYPSKKLFCEDCKKEQIFKFVVLPGNMRLKKICTGCKKITFVSKEI